MNNLSADEFLIGELTNNLESHWKLRAKEGKLTEEYLTNPSLVKLIQPWFPTNEIYTPICGALISMIIAFRMEGERPNELAKLNQLTTTRKVCASKNDF